MKFPILDIIKGTTVDGPGFRTSIYMAGCLHNCHGCQNPQSHNVNNGKLMSLEEIMAVIEEEDFNVTLSGGDPLFNPELTCHLVKAIKNNRRNLWIYTGYTWEEILESPLLFNAVKDADVIVDGRYEEELRDLDLPFRGSSNQRIINIPASLSQGSIVLFTESSAFK